MPLENGAPVTVLRSLAPAAIQGAAFPLMVAVLAGAGEQAVPSPATEQSAWTTHKRGGISVQATAPDAARLNEWLTMAEVAKARVQRFFGRAIADGLAVQVFPTRAAINSYWQRVFASPGYQFPCWMVASATRAGVSMLAPRLWVAEQCGHDGGNSTELSSIMAHEIVHVLHARISSHPEINGLLSIKWYSEGVASLAAGMYANAAGLASGAASVSSLSTVIDLPNSYALATSMATYIDRHYGRARHIGLMRHASTAEVLRDLGLSESQFIQQWRAWCCK